MAVSTFTDKIDSVIDGERVVEGLFTPSTSYLTPGTTETITTAQHGLKTVRDVSFPTTRLRTNPKTANTAAHLRNGYTVDWTQSAGTVTFRFWETADTEVADAVDKSTRPFRVRLHGV